MRLLVLLAVLTGCSVQYRASMSPKELLSAVRQAEVDRDGHAHAVERGLGHQHERIRLASLQALARTEEVGTASLAASLLGDRDREVATWAAFALGQIGDGAAEAALLAALDDVSPVPDQVLLALGRAGTATTARAVARRLTGGSPEVRAAAALALGLLGKRLGDAMPRERYARELAHMVNDPSPDVRYGAVYGLMRLPGPTAAVALIAALGDTDPEVRANAARGLGMSHAAPQVLDPVINDPDWRVRVEVVRSLGTIGEAVKSDAAAAAARLEALVAREFARFKRGGLASGRSLHVLLQIVSAADRLDADGGRVVDALERAPWNVENLAPDTAADLARLSCEVAYLLDQRDGVVRRVRGCGEPGVAEWRRLEYVARLLAHDESPLAIQSLVNMTGHQDPRVRAAAVVALGEVERPDSATALVTLLGSNDPYVVSAAAETLARPVFARFRPEGLAQKLGEVIEGLAAQPDAALVVGTLDAAGALGEEGRPLLPRLEALAQDPRAAVRRRAMLARQAVTGEAQPRPFGARSTPLPYTLPDPIRHRVELLLKTDRGEVLIELFGELAPHAVGTLVDRASRGLYRNRTFHRVVADFVVQGGCPRGDGWGGPGFTIPEETSPLPFVRGAVGIATNGRDTGGSQFFIMHSRHPHLEGGYSLVGRVVSGIDVIDALQRDDRIVDVEVRGQVR